MQAPGITLVVVVPGVVSGGGEFLVCGRSNETLTPRTVFYFILHLKSLSVVTHVQTYVARKSL